MFLLNNTLASYSDKKSARAFLAALMVFSIAGGLYTGVLNNYLHDILAIGRVERGIVEFPRELPGLLLFLLLALLYRYSESRLLTMSFFIGLVGFLGLFLYGESRLTAIIFIVIWSTGEHLIMPVRDSLAIHLADEGKEGGAMGAAAGIRNLGQVIGLYSVPLIFALFFKNTSDHNAAPYRAVFLMGAVILGAGLVFSARMHKQKEHVKRHPLYLKKKYTKYYILEIFFGARKQVFLTFAPYVLIMYYDAPTEYIAMLYGIWSISNIFLGPLMGRLLDRIGYRSIIIIDTVALTILCLTYGWVHHLLPHGAAFAVISVVFVIDAILFVVGMARSLYVKTISDSKEEVTSTLSTGISINHLVSIIIAIGGGFLWEALGMEALFTMAAVFSAGSFFFSLTLPKQKAKIR